MFYEIKGSPFLVQGPFLSSGSGGGSAFNGGLSQVGLWDMQYGGYYPFINYVKGGQYWTFQDNSGHPTPADLDANGYLLANNAHLGVYTVFYIPTQTERPGNYVIRWTGGGPDGLINLSFSNTLVSGSLSGNSGYAVITPTGTPDPTAGALNINVGPRAFTPGQPVTDLVMYHIDDEPDYLAGEVFQKSFKDVIKSMGVGSVRWLDPLFTNVCSMTKWSTRKPIGYFSYQSSEFRLEFYGGRTTSSGHDYSVSAPPTWSGLVDKATVLVQFNSNSAYNDPITLNVGGTGAKSVKNPGGGQLFDGINTDGFACCVYDIDLDVWMKLGGDDIIGLNNGIPPELIVRFCNEAGVRPWITLPYYACDRTLTDFVSGLCGMVKANLKSGISTIYEVSDEIWNNRTYSTEFANQKSLVYWSESYDYNDWYAMSCSLVGEAISVAYANDRSKYDFLCGFQTGLDVTDGQKLRLNALGHWVVEDGGDPPYDWVTAVTVATYWGSALPLTTVLAMATQYPGADAPTKTALIDAYVDTNDLNGYQILYEQYAQFGQSLGVNKMFGYEGGFSPDYPQGNLSADLVSASKAAHCVLGVSPPLGGCFPPVGSSVLISGVVGMTQLNSNTYTVLAYDAVANTITINVDSTGFTTYSSGGNASYVNSQSLLIAFYSASKLSTHLDKWTYLNYLNWIEAGGTFPSQYLLSGNTAWSIYDPDIYTATPSAALPAIQTFNAQTQGAATLSSPQANTVTSDGCTPAVTTDKGYGWIYTVTGLAGFTPTNEQIRAGTGGGILSWERKYLTSSGVVTFAPITSLGFSTGYTTKFLQGTFGGLSNLASVDFTTATAPHVSFDAGSSFIANGILTASWSHPGGASASSVAISAYIDGGIFVVASMTYGGDAVAEDGGSTTTNDGGYGYLQTLGKANCKTGTQTATVTFTGTGGNHRGGATTVTNSDLVICFNNHAVSAPGYGGSITGTCNSNAGDLMNCFVASEDGGSPGTVFTDALGNMTTSFTLASPTVFGSYATGTSPSVTVTYNQNQSDVRAMVLSSFKVA